MKHKIKFKAKEKRKKIIPIKCWRCKCEIYPNEQPEIIVTIEGDKPVCNDCHTVIEEEDIAISEMYDLYSGVLL
jgi:hypothetical protein